jgi:hypothetical protein
MKTANVKIDDLKHTEYVDSAPHGDHGSNQKFYKKYNVSSSEELNKKLTTLYLVDIKVKTYNYSFMLGCIVIVLVLQGS